eukprot:SAG31_NODE_12567_length_932_cov_0.985594_1_plen_167_part_01
MPLHSCTRDGVPVPVLVPTVHTVDLPRLDPATANGSDLQERVPQHNLLSDRRPGAQLLCPGSTRFCMLKSVWQDVQLGGWEPMVQTQELLQKRGAFLSNWRIHTPICSPSRSETISGRYFHSIKSKLNVPPEKLQPAATGHVDGTIYKNDSVGVHLRRAGYQTAIFG